MNTTLQNFPRPSRPVRSNRHRGIIDIVHFSERGGWVREGGLNGVSWYFLWTDNPAIRPGIDVSASVEFTLITDAAGRPMAAKVAPVKQAMQAT